MKSFFISLIGLSLILTSCSTGNSENIADEFHKKLDAGEIDDIVNVLFDDVDTTPQDKVEFKSFLQGIVAMGEQKNRKKKMGFEKKISNGISTVKYKYTFEVDGELIHERIVLVEREEGYKILMVAMHPDESYVEDFTEQY